MSCVNREQLKKDLLLYAVTDRSWLGEETLYEQVEKALKGGATFVQLREKELDEEHFLEEAIALKELCHKYHVPFVINDNVKIAKKMDADGVHVGQSDMEADDVRKIPDRIQNMMQDYQAATRLENDIYSFINFSVFFVNSR